MLQSVTVFAVACPAVSALQELPCGQAFRPWNRSDPNYQLPSAAIAPRVCKSFALVPGSTTGGCAEPGQANPTGRPVLLSAFNLSATRFTARYAPPDAAVTLPGTPVVVTDANSTPIGSGVASGANTARVSFLSFELTYACATTDSKRVFPYAPCECRATAAMRTGGCPAGYCNFTGCDFNAIAPSGGACAGTAGPIATTDCSQNSAMGCGVQLQGSYTPPCQPCGFYPNLTVSAMLYTEVTWNVMCTVTMQSDPAAASIGASQQTLCGATFVELDSRTPYGPYDKQPPPPPN